MSIEVIHGGSPIMALGLSELAPMIIRETIINSTSQDAKDEGQEDKDE